MESCMRLLVSSSTLKRPLNHKCTHFWAFTKYGHVFSILVKSCSRDLEPNEQSKFYYLPQIQCVSVMGNSYKPIKGLYGKTC